MEVNGKPKIKLSQDVQKVTMPGPKDAFRYQSSPVICEIDLFIYCIFEEVRLTSICFRLYSSDGHALIDLMMRPGEVNTEILLVK